MFDTLVKGKKGAQKPEMRNRADSNAKLKLTVGKRFADARELNGFGQTQAALMMGWKNATQLSLIEQGKRMPPHQVLIIASTVLGTSVDFLLGLSNEPERDPKQAERDAAMRHVHCLIEGNAKSMTGMLQQYLSTGTPAISTAKRLMTASKALVETVNRVRELNPKSFDEKLKGGAKLISAAEAMDESIHEVRMMLEKHERFADLAFTATELQEIDEFSSKFFKSDGSEAKGHHSDLLTPPEILTALGKFDLDPCASQFQPWRTAINQITIEDDGLASVWKGRVWCHPPHLGEDTEKFLKRMAEHGNGIAYVFAITGRNSFIQYCWKKASAILFIAGKAKFRLPGGDAYSPSGAPVALVAYGQENALSLANSGIKGYFLPLSNFQPNTSNQKSLFESIAEIPGVDMDAVHRSRAK